MWDVLTSALNPNSFLNLTLLAGLALVGLSLLCEDRSLCVPLGEKGGRLTLGPLSRRAHWTCLGLGGFLVVSSVTMFGLTNWGGIVSPVRSALAFESVLHAASQTPIRTLRVVERHVLQLAALDRVPLYAYVDEVQLRGSSRLLVFATDRRIDEGRTTYESLTKSLQHDEILLDTRVNRSYNGRIVHGPRTWSLDVRLRWFAIGKNFAEVRLTPAN